MASPQFNPAMFEAGRVTNPAMSEAIRQSLYDFQIYPGAGTMALTFFQSQVGQGITSAVGATAGTAKTLADTNMTLSGQLSNGLVQLVESIEVFFYPGSVSTANTYTIQTLTFFLAAASAVPTARIDDSNIFYRSGSLSFTVLAKKYLEEAPIGRFPPKTNIEVQGAIASNSATTAEVGFGASFAAGRPYMLDPIGVTLASTMNFNVTLTWPGLVALTSGFNARVGVVLDGFQGRASQ